MAGTYPEAELSKCEFLGVIGILRPLGQQPVRTKSGHHQARLDEIDKVTRKPREVRPSTVKLGHELQRHARLSYVVEGQVWDASRPTNCFSRRFETDGFPATGKAVLTLTATVA